ncbi:MAG TPA: hypothetical protein DHN33_07865 [Eubacteriaceae bacterium]|nr:hypothetical protein [Eubacteriaceae bacterium]
MGIEKEEVVMAFQRHTTSKIKSIEDLESLHTLGFRGEALSSIAAVAKITVKTSANERGEGILASIDPQKAQTRSISIGRGTNISIEELFFNLPARYKHMKKAADENKDIIRMIQVLALSNPDRSFELTLDDQKVLSTFGGGLDNTIHAIFGNDFAQALIEADYDHSPMIVEGYLGSPYYTKSTRKDQYLFINHRYIRDLSIQRAIEEAYDDTIMIHQHPVFMLNIQLPPHMLDVNVHPSKTKVKLLNESLVLLLLKSAVRSVLKKSLREKKIAIREDRQKEPVFQREEKQEIEVEEISAFDFPVSKTEYAQGQKSEKHDCLKEDSKTQIEMGNEKETKKENQSDQSVIPSPPVEIKRDDPFQGLHYIGQIFDTYLIFEKNQTEMILIDQHAAHERILYESLKRQYDDGKVESQGIMPVKLTLSPEKMHFLQTKRSVFEKMGYEFEVFSQKDIVVRAVPLVLDAPFDPSVLEELLEGEPADLKRMGEDRIIVRACKRAVKANKRLSREEVDALVEGLKRCDMPFTCPHGRPIVITMNEYDVQKLFKRVTG